METPIKEESAGRVALYLGFAVYNSSLCDNNGTNFAVY